MKKVLIVTGIAAAGIGVYKLGEIVGTVKTATKAVNEVEKIFPGLKENIVKVAANKIIDYHFHKDEEK